MKSTKINQMEQLFVDIVNVCVYKRERFWKSFCQFWHPCIATMQYSTFLCSLCLQANILFIGKKCYISIVIEYQGLEKWKKSNTAMLNITVYDHYLLSSHFIYCLMNEGTCNKMKVNKQHTRYTYKYMLYSWPSKWAQTVLTR